MGRDFKRKRWDAEETLRRKLGRNPKQGDHPHKPKQIIMTIEGNIKLIGEVQTFDSGFTKRQVVVTTNEQYPQEIGIDFTKDGCAMLDNFSVGQNVSVSINIRGNEHLGKYYVSLNGWKIETVDSDLPV